MNDVFLMVDDFNSKFSQGDWIEFEDYQGRKNIGKVSAQAEVIDGNPIVALDDIGFIDISEYGIKKQMGASIGRPDDFEDTASILGISSFADDAYIPLENIELEDTPPVQFGGGDFGGGGSSDSFETPEDGQQDDQDEDWEGDESEGEVDDSDDNDDE